MLFAVVFACATGCGCYAFLSYREAQLSLSASFYFNPAVARQLDPGITRAPHPAVVLGQSILSDSVVAGLVPQADLAASTTAHAIGEFRTRVELTQPTVWHLLVRYRDPNPSQAAATANAVAQALAGWAPSTISAPASAANAEPDPGRKPARASAAPQRAPAAESPLAAALGELHAQLSAADQRAGQEWSLRSEHDRQRHLESEVRAAQQKLYDLRSEFASSGSAPGGGARLDVIQHALALFWPSTNGLNTAGTSERQLDYEREQLTRVMGVIEQQKQAAERGGASNSSSADPSTQPSTSLGSQAQPDTAAAGSSPPASGVNGNPLRLEHMARLPAGVDWWPSALIGGCCGLLYWGLAFGSYRSSGETDDLLDLPEESAPSAHRIFDMGGYVPARFREVPFDAYPVETSSREEAGFAVDPGPLVASVPDQSPSAEPNQGSTADAVLDGVPGPEMVPTPTDLAEAASDADAVALLGASEERDGVFPEKIDGMADPWEEEIRRNLSQTTFARMLDPQINDQDVTAAKGPARDMGLRRSEPDRLAG
jgi:hypothetical protein